MLKKMKSKKHVVTGTTKGGVQERMSSMPIRSPGKKAPLVSNDRTHLHPGLRQKRPGKG